MRLLDLFCGAGGAAKGYHDAGFEVVGVDFDPQPRYPFEFHQADAMTFPLDGFDVIHASPPCQLYSSMTRLHDRFRHPDLVEPIRERLMASGAIYVIENVPGAPLRDPLLLCGSMFDLGADVEDEWRQLRRHRLWESNLWLYPPRECQHRGRSIGVYGNPGGYSKRDDIRFGQSVDWKNAMDIEWMTNKELAQAIPPAYTRWIGEQLRDAVLRRQVA